MDDQQNWEKLPEWAQREVNALREENMRLTSEKSTAAQADLAQGAGMTLEQYQAQALKLQENAKSNSGKLTEAQQAALARGAGMTLEQYQAQLLKLRGEK